MSRPGSVTALLVRRLALRHWRLHPGQTLLLVLILAVGVAGFVAIRLANRAALAGFGNFTETLAGRTDFTLRAPAGDLPADLPPRLREALGARPVHIIPVIETTASVPAGLGAPARTRPLLGLDIVAAGNLAATGGAYFGDGARVDFWDATGGRPFVWTGGDEPPGELPAELDLLIAGRAVRLPVAGPLPRAEGGARPPADLLVMDLAPLQELLGRPGRIDRVELLVEPGPAAAALRAGLPALLERLGRAEDGSARWLVSASGASRDTVATMTQAFRLNLTVLSLIALLVGLYLVFQALDGAVVRRRVEIGVLRSLGVEERAIRRAWLIESTLLGLAGGALGLLLGWAGAQGAVRAVGRTVDALYFNTTVTTASLTAGEAVLGLLAGALAALVAGWWPARAAARTPPAEVLPRSVGPASPPRWGRLALAGGACLLAGALCTRLPALPLAGGGRFPLAGYAAALLLIAGSGLWCAFLLPGVSAGLRRLRGGSAAAAVAGGHLRAPSGRHRLAAAALLCAVAMTGGMLVLVGSFERTLRGWIDRTLRADLYVSAPGPTNVSARAQIPADIADAVAAAEGVDRAARILSLPVRIRGITTTLSGADLSRADLRPDFTWLEAPAQDAFARADLALVSESFAERFGVRRGDGIDLPAPGGARPVRVAGVFADYGNEQGSVLVDRARLRDWFGDDRATSLALWVAPGVDATALRAGLRERFPGLEVTGSAALRAEVLRVFRQTFGITHALQVIGVAVALAGLGLTLASILLDLRAELTTLRALGFARGELAAAGALEGLGIALAGAVGGAGLAPALGWVLVHVVNKQAFGWTLALSWPWGGLLALVAAVAAAGALVGHHVGRRGAALPADQEE